MKLRDSLAENKSIRLQAEAETWQDAVKIGVDLLVAADVVEPRYYQAILDAVEQTWSWYFWLAWRPAMPHGRPEEGVKKTGFALVTLKKPLKFNDEDNDPVDILITMAAVDANTHQEVGIMQIVNLFEDEENLTLYVPAVPSRKYWISLTAPTRQLKKELKMSLPMLQVALDNQTMDSAYSKRLA